MLKAKRFFFDSFLDSFDMGYVDDRNSLRSVRSICNNHTYLPVHGIEVGLDMPPL